MSDAAASPPSSPSPRPAADESDLAYLKRLASAGRGEPAPFLLLMAVFGGAYGLAFVGVSLQAALDPGGLRPGADPSLLSGILRWSFVAAHLVFVSAAVWTGWRTLGPNPVRLSRAASATWSAAFLGLIATVISFSVFTRGQLPTDSLYAAYMKPPVLLVLWGCAWWVMAILSDRRWLLLVALGSFGAAIAMAAVGNTAPILPLAAACLLLLAFLPAIVLMRQSAR